MVNCIKITDLTAPELDVYARRSERQLLNRDDPAKGLFIAESPLVIGRALDAGYRPVSCLLEEGDAAGQAMLARCGD
ncbi:MAG: RNA methyltransferase, partial [Oscillospiraceae bacterium]|nr:RNA methyltransferase [Oscillospiraceae bacterium]